MTSVSGPLRLWRSVLLLKGVTFFLSSQRAGTRSPGFPYSTLTLGHLSVTDKSPPYPEPTPSESAKPEAEGSSLLTGLTQPLSTREILPPGDVGQCPTILSMITTWGWGAARGAAAMHRAGPHTPTPSPPQNVSGVDCNASGLSAVGPGWGLALPVRR